MLLGIILTLFIEAATPVMQAGFFPLLAMSIAGIGCGLAFQLEQLLGGRRRNMKWSLEGIVLFKDSLPIRQYPVLVPISTIAAFAIYGLTRPMGAYFLSLMPRLLQWFEMRDVTVLTQYSRSSLVVTFWLSLARNSVAGQSCSARIRRFCGRTSAGPSSS